MAVSLALTACDKAPVEEQKPVKFEVTSGASVEIDAEGGDLVIEYTIENPKAGATVMATTEAKWIKESEQSYATDGKIVLLIEPNEKENSRMATVEVRYDTFVKSVSVKQLGATPVSPDAPVLSVEKSSVEASVEGGSYSVAYSVENGVEGVEPVATTEAEWIKELKVEAGAISFVVEANEEFETREAKVTVAYEGAKSVEFSVKQVARTRPELIVDPSELEVAASGGEYSISYDIENAIAGESLKLTTEANWLTVSTTTYTIKLQAAANESPEPRQTTLKVEYLGVEPHEVVITQLGKQATTQTVEVEIDRVEMVEDYGGEFELYFTSKENKVYRFNIFADLSVGYIPNGMYSMADGTLRNGYCYHEYGVVNGIMLNASLEAITSNGETRFDISWTYNDVIYTILWTGAVIGFEYNKEQEIPIDPNATIVEVTAAEVNYDKAGEKQILFTAGGLQHQFNFKHADIAVSKPIPDGTYSSDESTMNLSYCIHDLNGAYEKMSKASVVIENKNNSTTRFVATWVYGGQTYAFDWTGAVKGYTYEDVSGQKLDFVPTYVEVSDAGFAGLYFYFYDARENELVLNYDREKVYMPYINYEGMTLNIDTSDYTFEFSDNGNGTYTYNARFVTADGRIIEFASTLPTTVS